MTKNSKIGIGVFILLCLVLVAWFLRAPASSQPGASSANVGAHAVRPPTVAVSSTSTTDSDVKTNTPSSLVSSLAPATVSHQLKLANGKTLNLKLPPGYSIAVAAQGYKHLRFMSESPDQRLFVGEMFSADDSSKGNVYIFDSFDAKTNTFKKVSTYLSNLRNPNSLAFYTDPSGQEWIYIAETDKLIRYKYTPGDATPHSAPETIAIFPDYGRDWNHGGWHLTRTVVLHNSTLYVSVGSSCNSCEEKSSEPQRGTILSMNPDGSDAHIVAKGLRNAVGILFGDDGALYATENGPDHLGDNKPNDTFFKIKDGTNYGWPYCNQAGETMELDTSTAWLHPLDCSTIPLATFAFDSHTAPLGFTEYEGNFLVALHGSGNKKIGNGYKVVSLSPDPQTGKLVGADFLSNFLVNGVVTGRPVDLLVEDSETMYVTDDFNGAIYVIRKN